MLTVIYGDNYTKKNKALEKVVSTLSSPFVRISPVSCNIEDLVARASGSSLFGDTTCFVMSHVQDVESLWSALLPNSSLFVASDTLSLVLIENEIDASAIATLEQAGAEIIPCVEDKKPSTYDRQTLSPFVLSDALFAHDKKEAWVTYYTLLELGTPMEEVESAVTWAMKSLALVAQTRNLPKNLQKTDLKPFVLNKVERGLSSWKGHDIIKAYTACILCMETYRFYEDYPLYLEKTILEILS